MQKISLRKLKTKINKTVNGLDGHIVYQGHLFYNLWIQEILNDFKLYMRKETFTRRSVPASKGY